MSEGEQQDIEFRNVRQMEVIREQAAVIGRQVAKISDVSAALADSQALNSGLHDALERQREVMAGLRVEVATKDQRIKDLEGRNKQQELSIIALAKPYKERDEALKAAQQCITDFLDVYGRGCSVLVLDQAAKSLKNDALKLVNRCLAKPELEAAQADGRTYSEGCKP